MEGANYQTCQSITLKKKKEGGLLRQVKWEDSSNSSDSLESSDSEVDDASSSPSSTDGPLFHLSDLMNQLPISRRGLSKHYQGKSQSFTSLSHVKNLEDLAKKVSPYGISSYHRMKSCKSYAAFDNHSSCNAKATTITQKSSSSRGSF